MSVGIPLPELNIQGPAPSPPPDALAEFQRASQLQTAAAQRQAIAAQTTAQNQNNQAQAMQLKDEQLRRSLAPQFVQKDDSGKPTGFDTEGLYNAMLQGGADPLSIQSLRMKQAEMQKSLIGLSDAQIEHQQKVNGLLVDGIESVRDANNKALEKSGGAAPQSAAPVSPMGPAVPGTGGMPAGMLPNMPAAQEIAQRSPIGAAQPGSPESLGAPPSGTAPTQSESALQGAASAPKPITPEAQQAYHSFLLRMAQTGVPIGQFKPVLTDTSDLDQAEAGAGLHAELLNQHKKEADIAEAAGKGAQSQAEAAKANIISIPELGGVYHVDTGEFKPVNGGTMSGAMLESKYVMDQAQKQRTGTSPDPQFDRGYERFKTLVPQFNINMAASGGGLGPTAAGAGGAGGTTGQASRDQIPAAIRGRVEAALDYRQPLPPAGRNNPVNNAISEWVYKVDPQHDETNFPARNKMMTALTSGPESTQINAINTALGHVGVLSDAIDGLKNNDTRTLNVIGNRLGVEFGTKTGDAASMFKAIIHKVGPELTAAYVQGGGGEGERGTNAADFDENLAPSILHGNAAITTQLLRSKIGSIENQYQNTMLRNDFQQRFITPEARRTLQKLSPQGGGGGAAGGHVIQIGDKQYKYKGSGNTADLANYDEVAR